MDINRATFHHELLNILEAIASSHFIAIDCEFSGVARSVRPQNGRIKQPLQERYQELKKAASQYQILQFGITCVEELAPGKRYQLRTYNVQLSPLLEEELEVERIFSIQSSAAEFLNNTSFTWDVPFKMGVSYLSRDEEDEAKRKAAQRLDRFRFEDIQLKEEDTAALAFLKKVRGEIDEWLGDLTIASESVTICSRTLHWRLTRPNESDLTSFDKRLVHQLVRAEYPQLISIGKANSISVIRFDAQRDALHKQRTKERLAKKINSHVGFRWIIEAMVGGDFEGFADPTNVMNFYGERIDFGGCPQQAERNERVAESLAKRRPVLVGHNVLHDLTFLYQKFIQDLPDTVDGFKRLLNRDFPLIVDTKYMATHNCGNFNPNSSLDQLDDMLSRQLQPEISLHPHFQKYDERNALHEAGFDSYLTARVMILLSAKLGATESPNLSRPSTPASSSSQSYADGFTLVSRSSKRSKPGANRASATEALVMPPFTSQFWAEYGNKLRVFGTHESFVDLNS